MIHSLYKNTIPLHFDHVKHIYSVNGVPADGCTTVLKAINKEALVPWAAKMASQHIETHLPLGRPIDEIEKKKLVDGCKKAHKQAKDDAGDLGTMLHNLFEKFAKGLPYDEPINPILKSSFEYLKKWAKDHKVVFRSSERVVYSKKHNVAGTLDLIAEVNGKLVLVDLKTSSGVWDEYWLQLAAYINFLYEEFPKLKFEDAIIIRCGKDGKCEIVSAVELCDKKGLFFEEFIADTYETFLSVLRLHRWLKAMKKKK